jgi:hypothetical protein
MGQGRVRGRRQEIDPNSMNNMGKDFTKNVTNVTKNVQDLEFSSGREATGLSISRSLSYKCPKIDCNFSRIQPPLSGMGLECTKERTQYGSTTQG